MVGEMSGWTPCCEGEGPPFNVPLRVRYADGSEGEGYYFQHDLGNEWVDTDYCHGDKWPIQWQPKA